MAVLSPDEPWEKDLPTAPDAGTPREVAAPPERSVGKRDTNSASEGMRTAEVAQAKKTRVADQQPKTNPAPRRLSSEEVDRPPQRQRVGTAPSDVPIPQ
eukprot:3669241-Rhodomonas_salina.1